jgi:hypothetical protein
MSHVYTAIIARFSNCYGEPKALDVEAFLGEYERILKGYSADTLRKAADDIIANHTDPSWPTPGECNLACQRVCERETPRSWEKPADYAGKWQPPTEEQRRRNRDMIEQFKRYVAGSNWKNLEPVKLPVPDRAFMENLQSEAAKTADGFARHTGRVLTPQSIRIMGDDE